ncbi:Predicted gene 20604 [Apodemus speciosus]|uniref:Predicted gene 20604 n=1 Tax=Apodemus speciosus TaxID=105296 RepID=A0ABQ0FEQ0_APOSI
MKELVAEFFGTLVEQDAQGVAEDPDDALDGDWRKPSNLVQWRLGSLET